MEYLVNSQQMQKYDEYTIKDIGIPALVLMERAALVVVDTLFTQPFDLQHVAIICGYGNNGGDGVAVARLLKAKQISVDLYLVGNERHASVQTQAQLSIAKKYNIDILPLPSNFNRYSTVIDAVFGVGLSRVVENNYADVINQINQSSAKVLSIDMPSGIDANNGNILGTAVKADVTVTFAFKKIGLVLYPGAQYAGVVIVKDIGIDEHSFMATKPTVTSLTCSDLPYLLPIRAQYSNKGSFGKVLVIAGSETMSGAAYFSAKAAYRTGCGLVHIYTADINRPILLSQLPEAIVTGYSSAQLDIARLKANMEWASVIIIGPGIGTSPIADEILKYVLVNSTIPIVIDADGLNLLAKQKTLLKRCKSPVIITPHLGEMSRLIQMPIQQIAHNLLSVAADFALTYQVTCVLKDARTIIADKEGGIYINQSGNNGMATGGSGDILTGVIGGLLAQNLPIAEAARLGVYLHGLAGDAATMQQGAHSVIAEDILNGLVSVLSSIDKSR